ITSIDLSSDGVASTVANGDVLIHGTTSFVMNGESFVAQDVSFATVLAALTAIDSGATIQASPTDVAALQVALDQYSALLVATLALDATQASSQVLDAIHAAQQDLSAGQIASLSEASFLQAITVHLGLDDSISSEVSQYLLASQQAIHHAGDGLADIAGVQHLLEGSFAQVLASVEAGDLHADVLVDLTHTLNAYSHGEISLDQLGGFEQQLSHAGTDHVITGVEYAHAVSSLPAPLEADPADLSHLVSSYLDSMHQVGDIALDGIHDTAHSAMDLNHQLDVSISDFIASHGLSDASYASIHLEVIDHLAHDLNDSGVSLDHPVLFDDQGHADSAAVISALDQHLQELQDHHNSSSDMVHHDVVSVDHPLS
ncbi:MAG: hypothetical protein ACKO0M_14130, partial [Cyanobium sp.]